MTQKERPRERLVVNFHGIGEPRGVPQDEAPYWCPRSEWSAFADSLAEVSLLEDVELEVTFDDGNLSDLDEAMPVLAARGLSATFHVCAGRIGQPGFLGEGELHELRASGMSIGSHGWNHVNLRKVDDHELVREVVGSRARIIEASGGEVTAFAIPFGSYDRRVLRALKDYAVAYTSDDMRSVAHRWLVPRFSYDRTWRPGDIKDLADRTPSSLQRLLNRVRGRVKALR